MPVSVSDSGCLDKEASSRSLSDEEFSWSFSYENGILCAVWHNYVADCCAGEFNSRIELVDESHLEFSVTHVDGMCDCICPYDVTSTYSGIEPGHYTLSFKVYDTVLYTTEIDIAEGLSKTFDSAGSGVIVLEKDGNNLRIDKDGRLIIDSEVVCPVAIYSIDGRCVASLELSPNSYVDLTSLLNGVYIVTTQSPAGKSTLRIMR